MLSPHSFVCISLLVPKLELSVTWILNYIAITSSLIRAVHLLLFVPLTLPVVANSPFFESSSFFQLVQLSFLNCNKFFIHICSSESWLHSAHRFSLPSAAILEIEPLPCKCVYSFGIVLLELVTSQRVIEFMRGRDYVNLAIYVSSKAKEGRLMEAIDERLITAIKHVVFIVCFFLYISCIISDHARLITSSISSSHCGEHKASSIA